MTTTQKIKLDFSLQGSSPRIRAVQGDLYTRTVEISLYSHKVPWEIPEGTAALIRYRKPDRTVGAYDTLPNGDSAYHLQGNTVTVAIAPDVLMLPGDVSVIVSLIRGEQVLSAFEFLLEVQQNHGTGTPSEGAGCCISGMLPGPEAAREGQILAVESVNPNGTVRHVTAIDLPYYNSVQSISRDDGLSGESETVYRVTMSDGDQHTFAVKNGKDGADGRDGIDGKDGADGKDGIDGKDGVDGKDGKSAVYYIATDHGVSPENADNTAAMRELMETVRGNGGGIIWLPVGEYRFHTDSSDGPSEDFRMCLVPKSGVSIVGESITGTVIKVYGDTQYGVAWMANQDDGNIISGCVYRNFTVDMSGETMETYTSTGKAFGMKGLKDCVFRDLRLLNTPSTSLGIDMLDNVVIDSVYIYRGGREWSDNMPGGAGIGIGTGKWANENYIIRNCVCDSCGHFGIFLEDQGLFQGQVRNYPEGPTVTNNIVRNGRYFGIGVRGGKNVLISGNNIYKNHGGIYLDYGAKNVMISNNIIADNAEAGLLFGIDDSGFGDYVCENIAVFGNSFFGNTYGVMPLRPPLSSRIVNNVYIGNGVDGFAEIPIDESLIKQGVYINDAGEEAVHEKSWLYDAYIDLNTTFITWTPIGAVGGIHKNPRIAIYDENKGFIHRINGDYQPDKLKTVIEEALTTAGKSTNYRYIKFGDNCNGEILATMNLFVPE